MNEKDKYLNIYKGLCADGGDSRAPHGKMGGGYGRICWGENMLETLKAWQVDSLFDVGCGYGNFCDAATLFVPRVFGLDIASVATGNVVDNPEITFFDGEAQHLPLPDQSVEWITSFDCLEHCPESDIDDILNEFDRVASKGFILSISHEPCECDGMPLHLTVKPESWWIDKLRRYGDLDKLGRTPITGVPYLICRKPVVRKVICYCAGGLGQRLCTLAAGAQLAQRTNRRLVMLWQKDDPLCRAGYSDLFADPMPEIAEEDLLQLTSCKVYALIKDVAGQSQVSGGNALRQAVRRWGCSDPATFSDVDGQDHLIFFHPRHTASLQGDAAPIGFVARLRPAAELKDRIDEAMSRLNLGRQVMGVHARGSDFGVTADAYARQMARALKLNPHQKFLVCSEDRLFERQLCRQFPENALCRPKTAWHEKKDPNQPWATGNVATSKESTIEVLIDIHLLARTRFDIYHESSAMAQLSVLMADTRNCQNGDHSAQPPAGMPAAAETGRASAPAMPENGAGRHFAVARPGHRIYYFCPDTRTRSAGIRRLYRHVALLDAAGFSAYIMHEKGGCRQPDMPPVPLARLDRIGTSDPDAIFVIPEGMPRLMRALQDHAGRRLAIALNWHHIFSTLPDGLDWRHFNIDGVLAVSPLVGELAAWSMGLPVYLLRSGIDHQRYYHDPGLKQSRVAFIARKAPNMEKLKRLLASRDLNYVNHIKWVALEGLNQDDYAAQIRKSSVFLSISRAEGFPTSCLEAMAAGALVAGYDSVGGRGILCGRGPDQNCILAPNGDYLSLAYALAPVLDDLLNSRMHRWQAVIRNARRQAAKITPADEEKSLIDFWHAYVNRSHDNHPVVAPDYDGREALAPDAA